MKNPCSYGGKMDAPMQGMPPADDQAAGTTPPVGGTDPMTTPPATPPADEAPTPAPAANDNLAAPTPPPTAPPVDEPAVGGPAEEKAPDSVEEAESVDVAKDVDVAGKEDTGQTTPPPVSPDQGGPTAPMQ